jgi:hypothetical protein
MGWKTKCQCYVLVVLEAGTGCTVMKPSRDVSLEVETMAEVHAHSTSYFRKAHARLNRAKQRLAVVAWQVRHSFLGDKVGWEQIVIRVSQGSSPEL